MALRFVLVSLVATLGFDLPNGADLARLVHSGQSWAMSQWQDWKDLLNEEDTALASADTLETTTEGASEPSELEPPTLASSLELNEIDGDAFRLEVRQPDLAEARTMDTGATTIEVIEVEVASENLAAKPADELDDDRFNEVVNAMVADLATEPIEELASNEEGASPSLPIEETAVVADSTDPESEIANFRTAVQLTGQALQAWMSVLQQTTPQGF